MFDTRAELLDVFRATPVVLRQLLHDVDAASTADRPSEDGWSIVEVVAHLADADETVIERVGLMVGQERPRLASYDEAARAEERGYRQMPITGALARFATMRGSLIARLERLEPDAWARTGIHDDAGEISVEALVAHMAAHDSIHLAQIARLLGGA